VIQGGKNARLAPEPRQPIAIVGDGVGQDLQSHVTAKLRVRGAIDFAHAAPADLSDDFEGAEACARGQCHV
jgi:hypothetical protein